MSTAFKGSDLREKLRNQSAGLDPISVESDGKVDLTTTMISNIVDIVTPKVEDKFLPEIKNQITKDVNTAGSVIGENVTKSVNALEKQLRSFQERVSQEIDSLTEDARNSIHTVRPVEIRKPDGSKVKLAGVQHEKFDTLVSIVSAGLHVFLVGPAGTGKSEAAVRVAEGLGLDFYTMSVGSQTSKSDLFGYMDAQGNYHTTPFRAAYEKGGLFLLDEVDAGNANVLVGINNALASGQSPFPDSEMPIKAHPDFRLVATGNTFGSGASRQYVGRNQLDAATLDRFTTLVWDIDMNIENFIAKTNGPTFGNKWLKVVRSVRTEAIENMALRAVVSPRATLRGSRLLEVGMGYEEVVQVALLANMPPDSRAHLKTIADAAWYKGKNVRATKPESTEETTSAKPDDLDGLVGVFNGE